MAKQADSKLPHKSKSDPIFDRIREHKAARDALIAASNFRDKLEKQHVQNKLRRPRLEAAERAVSDTERVEGAARDKLVRVSPKTKRGLQALLSHLRPDIVGECDFWMEALIKTLGRGLAAKLR